MRALSLTTGLFAVVLVSATLATDSPHGKDFNVPCEQCHSAKGWYLDKEIYSFDHNGTRFPLTGQHEVIDCRQCHFTLVFSDAREDCMACHTDIHYQTVGPDCQRCHTTFSWIVNNITDIHRVSRFPLVGAHYTADCSSCHPSASLLRFEPQGVACYDCHRSDYESATNPNHVQGQFSTDCSGCHMINAFSWTNAGVNHDFFPLELGHAIGDCQQCHTGGTFSGLSPACSSCHMDDYNATTNPNHFSSSFPVTCSDCHTLNPSWKPAEFTLHDAQYFPVYSGKHQGTWISCSDCHTNGGNFTLFTCIDCHDHNQADMDEAHQGIGGYIYESQACYECHPTGEGEGGFNHNLSGFPLTGAHITTPCSGCHISGYSGTPSNCDACHINNYNSSTNPNHTTLSLPITCGDCHTTNPDWKPASFPIHNDFFLLQGAHSLIAQQCDECHQGNYMETPNTCVGCHQDDYNGTTSPSHSSAHFPTDCETCHTQTSWTPSTFDHDNLYFPIYSGKHRGEWTTCADCHPNPSNYAQFTCIDCHEHNQPDMDDEHSGVPGYQYNSIACYTCHPTGGGDGKFKSPVINRKSN